MDTTERDKHAIRAYVLKVKEEKKNDIITHHVFVDSMLDYSLQPVYRKNLGDIGFSLCKVIEDVRRDELFFQAKPKLVTYRSNVKRIWDSFFTFFEEQREEALKYANRRDVRKECHDVSIHDFGEYFNRFMQLIRTGHPLVQCIPEVDVFYSGIENEHEFPTMFGNHRNSRAK